MKYVLFDVDGVILSEERCFDVSALVVWEWLTRPDLLGFHQGKFSTKLSEEEIQEIRQRYWLNNEFLAWLKAKGINSNWDMVHAHLLGALGFLIEKKPLNFTVPTEVTVDTIQKFNKFFAEEEKPTVEQTLDWLKKYTPGKANKKTFFEALAKKMGDLTNTDGEWAQLSNSFWQLHTQSFQDWYLGNSEAGKDGFLTREIPIVEPKELQKVLKYLQSKGYVIGVGTGRGLEDTKIPFQCLGLWDLFTPNHIATADDALMAALLAKVPPVDKPHPFTYQAAWWGTYPEHYVEYLTKPDFYELTHAKDEVYIVGDSVADVMAAEKIGATMIATLTGLTGDKIRPQFEELGVPYIVDNVLGIMKILC